MDMLRTATQDGTSPGPWRTGYNVLLEEESSLVAGQAKLMRVDLVKVRLEVL